MLRNREDDFLSFLFSDTDSDCCVSTVLLCRSRILVQATVYRRLLIGRDGHLDQSSAYDISQLVQE